VSRVGTADRVGLLLLEANATPRGFVRDLRPACLAGKPSRYRARVATVETVSRIIAAFPEVTEGERFGNRTWSVRRKAFAWDRPFSKADLRRFGDEPPPPGPILAVRVADLADKEAVLAAGGRAFFTIPHFDGYAAVLIQLDEVDETALREALVDAWLACAPVTLAREYLGRE